MFKTHIWYNMAQNHVFLNIHNILLIIEFIWFLLCKIKYGLRYGINSHIITNHHANLSPYPILPTAMPTPYLALAHSKGSRGLQASSMRRHLAVVELALSPLLQWCCCHQCAGIFAVVAMAAALWFYIKSLPCKIELKCKNLFTKLIFNVTCSNRVTSNIHNIYTCKINFLYIQYYLAAKIDFTGKSILAAPDLLCISWGSLKDQINCSWMLLDDSLDGFLSNFATLT